MAEAQKNKTLDRRRVTGALAIGIGVLTAANLVHVVLWNRYNIDVSGFSWRFDMSGDSTVPTWFSSFMLALGAVLCWAVAHTTRQQGGPGIRHWFGLAVIFAVLSLDEVATLHETSANLVRFETSGFFYYSWVVIGLGAVVLFAVAYLRFFLSLGRQLQIGLAVAAAVYVGGALGIEMINARQEFTQGAGTIRYQLGTAVEELAEMVGILILIDVLLRHLRSLGAHFSVDFGQAFHTTPTTRPHEV